MKRIYFASLGLLAILSAGCSLGNAPEPMSADQVKGEVEKLKPEQQIDWINRSPMPPSEKQAKIAEIRKKYGLPEQAAGPAAPGAPSTGR